MNQENMNQENMNQENCIKDEDVLFITCDDISNTPKNKEYKITSIDVGVINFGISVSILNEDFTLKEIIWIDNIDITKYKHTKCSNDQCKLYHTKTFSDWIEHTIQENKEYFDDSDMIIIEKQPPQGFVVIEQLIFSKYRKNTSLISPQSVHKFYNFFSLDYEKRKELSVIISDKYLSESLMNRSKNFERRHDIADSICMMLYFINKKQEEYKKSKRYNKHNENRDMNGMNAFDKLEKFRYYKDSKSIKKS